MRKEIAYDGFLETYNRYKVRGWAVSSDIETIPELDLFVNHIHIATFKPSIERVDLGRKLAGFEFIFAGDLFPENQKVATIDVKYRASGKSLRNSPVVCSINPNNKNRVLIGKDDVLFLIGDSNDVINQVSGRLKLPIQAENDWQYLLANRKNQAEERALPIIHLVVPDKERVYSDKLPDNITISSSSTFQQWKELLPVSSNVLYPLAELIENRIVQDTYCNGDTHWNEFGAYICYQQLCNMLSSILAENIEATCLTDKFFQRKMQNADLLAMLGEVCVERQIIIDPSAYQYQLLHNNRIWLAGRQVNYRSTKQSPCTKRLLVFHDSFGPYLEKLLATTFIESKFIWNADILWDEVDAFKPDIVLIEQVERFLIKPPCHRI